MRLLLLAVLVIAPAYGACTQRGSTGVWHCASTGDPNVDGETLWNFISITPLAFACGDTIILDAGATYRTLNAGSFAYGFRLRRQTGCGGRKTQIISSLLAGLPPGKRVTMDNLAQMPILQARAKQLGDSGAAITIYDFATNMYAFRGVAITTDSDISSVNNTFHTALISSFVQGDVNRRLIDNEYDIEFDRCLIYPGEETTFGPMTAHSSVDSYFRSVSVGMSITGSRYSIHDSSVVGFGGSDASLKVSATFTAGTNASPAVLTSVGIAAAYGIANVAGCTTGCTAACWAAQGCRMAAFAGATGNWADLNGLRYITYESADSVRVGIGGPYELAASEPISYDSTSKGAMTGTITAVRAVPIEPTFAIVPNSGLDFSVVNNYIDGGQMPVFTGGSAYSPTDNRATVLAGTDATHLVLSQVANLSVGDLIDYDTGARPTLCPNSGKGCWYTTHCVGMVTAISGNTVTITPWGPSGTTNTATLGTATRWNGNNVSFEVRRNTVHRASDVPATGKGYLELKTCVNCLIDGNIFTDTLGTNIFITARNQGNDPWLKGGDLTFSNNLFGGSGGSLYKDLTQGEDDEKTSTRSYNISWENNVMPSVKFPVSANLGQFAGGGGTTRGGFRHNTSIPETGANTHYFMSSPDCFIPYYPDIPGDYLIPIDFLVRDNLVGYGEGLSAGFLVCWPTRDSSMLTNLFLASGTVNSATIMATYPGNNAVANSAAVPLVGTCAFATWEQCALDPASPYKGTASDGGDPGADIPLVKDRLNGWSETAGLTTINPALTQMALRLGNWNIGSVYAVVNFNLFGSSPGSGCTVELFTDRDRVTTAADAPTAQACNRASSITGGNSVSYVFGGSVALSANTEYFYKITDGTRVMVGAFTTTVARAASTTIRYTYATARTGALCSDPGMSVGCTNYSSSTAHDVVVPNGVLRYYRAGTQPIQPLTW